MTWHIFAKHEGLIDAGGKELPVATADTLADAFHYARVYGQDGPTRIVEIPGGTQVMTDDTASIHIAEAVDRIIGRNRSKAEIFQDGCDIAIYQTDNLIEALVKLKVAIGKSRSKGREVKEDLVAWRRAIKAAEKLFTEVDPA